ncbi:MAG: hypothetical protein AAF680_05970, partial [Pseudomonadota bacterium]
MKKQLVMALLAAGALAGMSGCSEGDSATINIDAPTTTNNNSGGGDGGGNGGGNGGDGGGDGGGPTPSSCPAGTTEITAGTCRLSGTYLDDLTLAAGNVYELDGRVNVGNGNCLLASSTTCDNGDALVNATLTIEPG